MAAARFFILDQVFQINDIDVNAIDGIDNSLLVAGLKINAREGCQQLYSQGDIPHSQHFIFLQKKVLIHFRKVKAEFFDYVNQLFGVSRTHTNPDVHIAGCPWIAMIPDGIPADQQIFNAVGIQQFQKILQVLR